MFFDLIFNIVKVELGVSSEVESIVREVIDDYHELASTFMENKKSRKKVLKIVKRRL